MGKYSCLVFFLLSCISVSAQTFQRGYNYTDDSLMETYSATPYGSDHTLDGGYILLNSLADVTGPTYPGFYLLKTDSNGVVKWSRLFIPEPNDYYSPAAVHPTHDGGYIITGYTNDPLSRQNSFLIKTDSAGNLQWNRHYGSVNDDEAYAVIQTKDHGYIFAGKYSMNGASITKVDSLGSLQWCKAFDVGTDIFASIIQTADSGFVMAGQTSSVYGLIMRTDARGNLKWGYSFTLYSRGSLTSVTQTSDGGFAFAGGTGGGPFPLVKTDSAGKIIWSKVYSFTDNGLNVVNQYANDIKETPDKGLIIAGTTGRGALLFKTDSNGNAEWARIYASPYVLEQGGLPINQTACTVLVNKDHGYYFTAEALGFDIEQYSGTEIDIYAVRTDSNGIAGSCNYFSAGIVTDSSSYNVVSPNEDINITNVIEYTVVPLIDSVVVADDSLLSCSFPTGQAKISDTSFLFIQNPATNILSGNFVSSISGSGKWIISDITGRIILTTKYFFNQGDNTFNLDIQKFSSGLYILQLKTADEHTVIRKFVKIE